MSSVKDDEYQSYDDQHVGGHRGQQRGALEEEEEVAGGEEQQEEDEEAAAQVFETETVCWGPPSSPYTLIAFFWLQFNTSEWSVRMFAPTDVFVIDLWKHQVENDALPEEETKEESDEEEDDDEESGRLRFKSERKDSAVVRLSDSSKRRSIPETLGANSSC